MRRKKVYIHYGSSHFDPDHMLGGGHMGKPDGFWASPKYGRFRWIDFCLDEHFHIERLNKHIKFRLKKGTRILNVKCLEDIIPYLTKAERNEWELAMYRISSRKDPTRGMKLDMDKIKANYDGMEVYMCRDNGDLHRSYLFSAYDVDSLVIWNLDRIVCI